MNQPTTYIVPRDNESKTHALISYIVFGVGMFTAVPVFVAAIWAMIKKGSAQNTIYHSHFCNITRTFWWSLLWAIIGGLLTFIGIGYLILGVAWVWTCYRLLNGFAKLMADVPYPL